MAELKTKKTEASIEGFIKKIPDQRDREGKHELKTFRHSATGFPINFNPLRFYSPLGKRRFCLHDSSLIKLLAENIPRRVY